jgi:hypothetical protein
LQIVKNLPDVPSIREMQEQLRRRGLRENHRTVLRDYQALGLSDTEVLFPDPGGTEIGRLSCYSNAKCNTLDKPSSPNIGFKVSTRRLNVAERISQRRQLIRDFVGEFGGRVPSVRRMSELLAAKGCVGERQTISTDYRALGYTKPAESQVPLPIELPRAPGVSPSRLTTVNDEAV